ncbi:uncharacterized protein LOC112590648 [Harpegnathos saltator]|uniref:uncharacterized protein LOC112590648 n=1 Tax=Harpegnathos saltator TaxID=610380 RepID=UPI000DBEF21C|nr:uncharacterized protein LOC112590648 [Harpegnathos saltator]
MRVLKFTLVICALAGCWQPSSWTSLCKRVVYKIYAIFLLSSLYIFSVSQFMNIILNVENSDEFTDALYMMLTVLVAAYKQTFMLLDRGNITMIIDQLTVRPFAPCESHEVTIRRKFDKMIQ